MSVFHVWSLSLDYILLITARILVPLINLKRKTYIGAPIKLHVVHRLRPRDDGKPKTVMAKFESRKNRDKCLKAAPVQL